MDFESAMQTFAEAWMAANRGGRILIPTENQPKIQESNGSGSGAKSEEEENNSKNGDDERVSLDLSSNYGFKNNLLSYLFIIHSLHEFLFKFCRQVMCITLFRTNEFHFSVVNYLMVFTLHDKNVRYFPTKVSMLFHLIHR